MAKAKTVFRVGKGGASAPPMMMGEGPTEAETPEEGNSASITEKLAQIRSLCDEIEAEMGEEEAAEEGGMYNG